MASEQQENNDSLLVLVSESQVHAFDLSVTFRIAIGRHETNDLQLNSQTVSNYHAEIMNENGRLVLRDLGSTNGSFVNDERVREKTVESGDRIRIGSHVLALRREAPISKRERLLRVRRSPEGLGPGTTGAIVSIRAGSRDALKTVQVRGQHDLPLADLLKILCGNEISVVVTLRLGSEQAGLWVRKDRIVHVEYGSARGEKALYRVFGWADATYRIDEYPDDHALPRTIDLPVDTLILEGMKHAGEIGALLSHLPPLDSTLVLKEDCTLPPSAYTPAELEVFQTVIRQETLVSVLESSRMTDTVLLRLLDGLLRKGVFGVARGPQVLEETCNLTAQELLASAAAHEER